MADAAALALTSPMSLPPSLHCRKVGVEGVWPPSVSATAEGTVAWPATLARIGTN